MTVFLDKLEAAVKEKNSVLCVGLDPKPSTPDEMLEFCLGLVDQTSDFAAAFKPNQQFIHPFSGSQIEKLTRAIHNQGCVSILDLKLGDIGSTNDAAIHWLSSFGFDAFTFSPFAGNLEEATKAAHAKNLGIISLCLMSNPDAKYFMLENKIEGKPGFEWIAEKAKQVGTDGVVVGATNDASQTKKIRDLTGSRTMFLVPGVGAQGGDAAGILKLGGNALINVGRGVFGASVPAMAAREYRDSFNQHRKP